MNGFHTFSSRLIVTGKLITLTPLRVGAGKSTDATESDQPVIKDVLGQPVIPGSSLKGVLRSHIEAVLRAVELSTGTEQKLACDLLTEDGKFACIPSERLEELQKDVEEKKRSSIKRDELLLDETCWICRLFGAPWLAAKLAVRDLSVDRDYWTGRYLIRDGVAIDRDRGVAADKKKYTFEAVPTSTWFDFTVQIDNASEAELGLACLVLRALEEEQIQLGGARSRGLGWCKLIESDYKLHASPVDYLLNKAGETLDEARRKQFVESFLQAIGVM